MKKFLLTMVLMMGILFSSNLKAQYSEVSSPTPFGISLQGGYSWLNGVVGGEIQYGHFSVSGGWMPTTMPVSGAKVTSGCFAGTYYSATSLNDYAAYISVGVSTKGYQYEDLYGNGGTEPVTIVMVGSKYEAPSGLWLKRWTWIWLVF